MFTKIITASLIGLEAHIVNVETDLSQGLPVFNLVGLPDMTVRESKERIRSAIVNSDCDFPRMKITVNLSPASIKKEGSHFDLPIALGILSQTEKLDFIEMDKTAFIGELSLDGSINRIDGALPLVIGLRKEGIKTIILPEANIKEASIVKDVQLIAFKSLRDLLDGHVAAEQLGIDEFNPQISKETYDCGDYSDIYGQEHMKRVMEICAAACHGLLMIGPPGCGKTMLAKRLPSILPVLSYGEMLETTVIYSVAGRLNEKMPLVTERPFRAPHHSISEAALLGGGISPKPGELSLAHNGVLFLDELPEFNQRSIEMMRQPIEDGFVSISRQKASLVYPCRSILICAGNPCRCGYYGDKRHKCTCSEFQVINYMNKYSGPLLERMDLQVELTPVDFNMLIRQDGNGGRPKSSAEMRIEVEKAIEIQKERYKRSSTGFNAYLNPSQIKKYCRLGKEEESFLREAFESFSMSARTYNKVLKVARTIADLNGNENIGIEELAEAVSYRQLDKRRSRNEHI